MWRARIFIVASILGACSAPVIAPDNPTGELIAVGGGPGGASDACFTCHGLKGEGDNATPRLASLSSGYLIKQLVDYGQRKRDHPAMSPIAARLGDGDRMAVAAYYAGLKSADARARPAEPTAARLFAMGDPDRRLNSCASCHGASGEGGLATPRIAGQTEAYLRQQLLAWRASERRNDPEDKMGAIARKLTLPEIDRLASFLAGVS